MSQFETLLSSDISQKIEQLNWHEITENLHENGYAILSGFLTDQECEQFKNDYTRPELYRKTVNMQRFRFGLGEYKYFNYPLPNLIQQLRTQFYPYLVPIANAWFEVLKLETRFAKTHAELLTQCQKNEQDKATALILKYEKNGFNTLHQDLYGEVYFPIQMVIFLSQINQDYIGGEFVMTEQIPRAQSKAIVLKPNKRNILIMTTQFRPQKGQHGYYRVNMKHGVSAVQRGERYALGIIFHDAKS